MDFDMWIQANYQNLVKTTKNIVKNDDDGDDLLHCVLEQLLKNKMFIEMEDKDRLYFFIRTLKNNYFSSTSPYYYQYKKPFVNQTEFNESNFDSVSETDYQEKPDIDWVHRELNKLDWFNRDLFLLWMELGTLTAVSQRTLIPINSVGRYIKKTKLKLREQWANRN
jgi:hypothetical protein